MSVNKQLFFWLLSLAAFILFLTVFQGILLPFVAGMALAYLLDPIADYLETHGFGRIWPRSPSCLSSSSSSSQPC
nr:hypothetical protein [Pseudovibrio denitrificans]